MAASGQLPVHDVPACAAAAGGVLLWGLYFTLGFRAFSRGMQASALGLLLTVGLPLACFASARIGYPSLGAVTPPGVVHSAATAPIPAAAALGAIMAAGLALATARRSLREGDAELRRWYDRCAGAKVMR